VEAVEDCAGFPPLLLPAEDAPLAALEPVVEVAPGEVGEPKAELPGEFTEEERVRWGELAPASLKGFEGVRAGISLVVGFAGMLAEPALAEGIVF
jgi:hypothetical protein